MYKVDVINRKVESHGIVTNKKTYEFESLNKAKKFLRSLNDHSESFGGYSNISKKTISKTICNSYFNEIIFRCPQKEMELLFLEMTVAYENAHLLYVLGKNQDYLLRFSAIVTVNGLKKIGNCPSLLEFDEYLNDVSRGFDLDLMDKFYLDVKENIVLFDEVQSQSQKIELTSSP